MIIESRSAAARCSLCPSRSITPFIIIIVVAVSAAIDFLPNFSLSLYRRC